MSCNYGYKFYPLNPTAGNQEYEGFLEEDYHYSRNSVPANDTSIERTTAADLSQIANNQDKVYIVHPVVDTNDIPVAEPVIANHVAPVEYEYHEPQELYQPGIRE